MGRSEVFLSFLISSCIACILALGQQMYKSKCSRVQIGCIKIERKVEIESDVESQIELPTFNPTRKPSLDDTIHGKK